MAAGGIGAQPQFDPRRGLVGPAPGPRPAEAARPRSPVGRAVEQAVWSANLGTVPRTDVQTDGRVVGIWMNGLTGTNLALRHVIQLIGTARQEVCIQEFAWDYDGEACKELLTALAAQQRRFPGLKIRIAYDKDLLPWGKQLPNVLASYGIKAELASYSGPLSRAVNHTKMFVVDGHTGVIGGDNVQNHPWKDLLVAVQGPVVDSLLADFDDAWRRSKSWYDASGHKLDRAPDPGPHAHLPAPASDRPLVPMTVLTKKGGDLDGARSRGNDADRGLLAAIAGAQRTIKLESPNCNDPDVWDAIADAAKRGVKVQVLLAKGFNQLRSQLDRANNDRFLRFIAKLPPAARANVEMRWYAPDGKKAAGNHTKYASVDGEWAYVGSQNLDNQSFAWSREVGLGIDDAAQTAELDHTVFDADWATSIPAKPAWWDFWLNTPARDWGARIRSWLDPRSLLAEFF